MSDFRARIGRIRMKNGGADVRVLDRKIDNPNGENWRGKVIENAKAVASYDEEGSALVGYILIGIYSDGLTSVGFRYDPEQCPVPRSLMPAWVAELVRRDMIVAPEASDKFKMGQRHEPRRRESHREPLRLRADGFARARASR
jgi:hypothetical protein